MQTSVVSLLWGKLKTTKNRKHFHNVAYICCINGLPFKILEHTPNKHSRNNSTILMIVQFFVHILCLLCHHFSFNVDLLMSYADALLRFFHKLGRCILSCGPWPCVLGAAHAECNSSHSMHVWVKQRHAHGSLSCEFAGLQLKGIKDHSLFQDKE